MTAINAAVWVSLADQDPLPIVRATITNEATSNLEVVALLRAAADAWERAARDTSDDLTAADVTG